jgi:hypothetical protein
MQTIRECQDVSFEFRLQPHPDTILHDEMEGAGTDAQDQARQFWRHPVPRRRPPAIVLSFELGRVQGVILIIGAVQEVVAETICTQSTAAAGRVVVGIRGGKYPCISSPASTPERL